MDMQQSANKKTPDRFRFGKGREFLTKQKLLKGY
jgi:hypothetical protein